MPRTITELDLSFMRHAAIEGAWVPVSSAADAGRIALGGIRDGNVTGGVIAADDLTGSRLEHVTASILAVRRLLGAPESSGLAQELRYRRDLVRSSFITTTVDLASNEPVARTRIERPTASEIARFANLAKFDPGFIDTAYQVNRAAALELDTPDGPATRHTTAYALKAEEIDEYFSGDWLSPEDAVMRRQDELESARATLAEDLRPLIQHAITGAVPYADMSTAARNMARCEPGAGIIQHHYPRSPLA
ncbi:MAG TPA: hypothetical protein VLF71_02220 [Candidatus Saccharimonadales bacterium]|nr:hypothetical protein [Candidatus Saccharimonadales bacterium]